MFKSILVPVDLAENKGWESSLAFAKKVAGSDAAIHLVNVVPDFGMAMVGGYFDADFIDKARQGAADKLSEFVAANFTDGEDVHPHIASGSIYQEILSAANKLGCDAIVIGAHSPDMADWLLGSNASKVVNHAKQSVFVIRD